MMNKPSVPDPDLRAEYDFASEQLSSVVVGKYAARYRHGVKLPEDVRSYNHPSRVQAVQAVAQDDEATDGGCGGPS